MGSEREIFSLSGAFHLTDVDWNNSNHRRSVAASLTQGVNILERDRQNNRQGPHALAPPWWNFFHFQLTRILVDDSDHSIFGAIYEFKLPASYIYYPGQMPPQYVIAFRGTINKLDTRKRDLKLDLQCIRSRLHKSSRFQIAMNSVHHLVAFGGAANVWLAGHSLGSAIALLVGRNMVKMGYHLETYLFNPPFASAPIETIKHQKLKHGIRFASSLTKAGLAVARNVLQQNPKKNNAFAQFSAWIPYLFVNPSDPICSEYIGYFKHRQYMQKIGAGGIERVATQNSISNIISGALGSDSEPIHLLPSAYLTINLSHSQDFKQAHGIRQWWSQDINCQFQLHQFR